MSEEKKETIVRIVRLSLTLILAILGMTVASEEKVGLWPNFAIMMVAWLICGYDLIIHAVKDAIEEHEIFNEDLLMIVASAGAFCLRFFGENEFVEAVVIVWLFQIGEWLEDISSEKSHKAITEAISLRAKTANLIVDDEIEVVEPESLKVGDSILVKVGEIVPIDGTVYEGEGELDMSSLTGEFLTVAKHKGDYVNSGTVLKTGSLKIRAEKAYEDSTVSKIMKLVEESAENKGKASKFITKFAKWYTPLIMLTAALVAIIVPLIVGPSNGDNWARWLKTAISILVIGCPCAVVISVPLAYFAGIGLAGKNGIIVKGADYFDELVSLGVVVTDKTGTLTEGKFSISAIHSEIDEEAFLDALSIIESRSNHPIAKAIVDYHPLTVKDDKFESYEELAGKGIACVYDGHEYWAGNRALFEDKSLQIPSINCKTTFICLAIDGKYVGYVELEDKLKAGSKVLMNDLKALNIKSVMLTGDKKESAAHISSELGIDECYGELLPEQKIAHLRTVIEESNKPVVYVGDGINDAASIAMADVGFAMGQLGSDMAIESADIVLMNDDPSSVTKAVKISKITRRKAISNIVIALGVKFTIMILALCIADFPLWIAVLCDTGLTSLLVLYTLTLLWKKVK